MTVEGLSFPRQVPDVGTVVSVTWQISDTQVSVCEAPVVRRGIKLEGVNVTYEILLFWVEGEINRLTYNPDSDVWTWGQTKVEVSTVV